MSTDDLSAGGIASLAALSLLSAFLAGCLHRNRFPGARFRERRPREPPLWGGREVAAALVFWIGLRLFLGSLMASLAELGLFDQGVAFAASQLAVAVATLGVLRSMVVRGAGQPAETLGFVPVGLREVAPALFLWLASIFPLRLVHLSWLLLIRALGAGLEAQEVVEAFRGFVASGQWTAVACHVGTGVFIVPIVEEALFRGFIFGALRRSMGPLPGAALSSLAFAALHLSLTAFAPLFVLGLLLAYLYERTGSLYPSVAFHAVFNAGTYLLLALGAA